MVIYAYGSPGDDIKPFIYDSLVNQKISRFLWSWYHDCDLNRLKNVPWDRMSSDEKESWERGRQLLDFRPGDWILHKNVPQWGQVTAARLSSEYFYQNPLPAAGKDGRVHPNLYRSINVRGSLYRVSAEKEFYESLAELGYKFDEADYKAAAQVGAVFDGKESLHVSKPSPPAFQKATSMPT